MTRKTFLRLRITACFITILGLAEHSPELVGSIWQFVLLIAAIGVIAITIYGDLDELSDFTQKKSAQDGHPEALS